MLAYVGSVTRHNPGVDSCLAKRWALIAGAILLAVSPCSVLANDVTSRAIYLSSVGLPPEAAIEYVAKIGVARQVDLRQGKSVKREITDWCGYESEHLTTKTEALNKELIGSLGGVGVVFSETEEQVQRVGAAPKLRIPACIIGRGAKMAKVRGGEGIAAVLKRELTFEYEASDRHFWQPYVRQICDLNKKAVSCSPRTTATPGLPEGVIKIPYALSLSLIDIDRSIEETLPKILEKLEEHLRQAAMPLADTTDKRTPPRLFLWGKPIAAPKVVASLPMPCAAAPIDLAYDVDKLLRLAAVYTTSSGRLIDTYPRTVPPRRSVVTVIDTGIHSKNEVLRQFLYLNDQLGNEHDSSNADAADPDAPGPSYPVGDFGTVTEGELLDRAIVRYSHGTHVAGLAMGRGLSLLPLSGDDELGHLGEFLPRLRVFRALHLNPAQKYDLTSLGFIQSLRFLSDRVGQQNQFNVINFSIGISDWGEASAQIDSLANQAVVVAAAGNDGRPLESLNRRIPARLGGATANTGAFVITVGAMDLAGLRWSKSNFSRELVDLFAPGECQPSFDDQIDQPVPLSGTSQAAPWVAFTAALLFQMPMPGKHPVRIKNRLVSSVDSRQSLADASESGGSLDPFRAIDVLVDHIKLKTPSTDGEKGDRNGRIRAWIDYANSEPLCTNAQVNGPNHVSRFEVRDDGTAWFRDKVPRDWKDNPVPPGARAPIIKLKQCTALLPKAKIRYFADVDFEALASGKAVASRSIDASEVAEIIPRVFENMANSTDLARVLSQKHIHEIFTKTKEIMWE
ncbi:MAG: S8/S53 family peptidase [Reyranella sp.]